MKAEKDEEKKKSKMTKENRLKFEKEQKQKQLNDLGRRGKGKVCFSINFHISTNHFKIFCINDIFDVLWFILQQTTQDEERGIHESYQILLSEYHSKKALREKKAREKMKANDLKAKEKAEAERLKAEQDQMRSDMDKFFDASGAVVSKV